MKEEIILEGEILDLEGERIEEACFGEYGERVECLTCYLRKKCKRFTQAERAVTIRYKGKYSFRGKERRKDRY